MDYNTDKIYIKSKNAFLSITIGLTILFFVGLSLQSVFPVFGIQLPIAIFMVVILYVFNLLLGMTGFILSLILNILQIIIYAYKATLFRDYNNIFLLGFTMLSIVIILLFQLFMRRVSNNIISLRDKIDEEQQRRITSETTSLIENSMIRQNLIARHDNIKDASSVSDAIATSRSTHMDSLTTLPGREKIFGHIDNLVNECISSGNIKKISVIYMAALDPEHFLENLGHRATDLFIQCIAHRIRECADPEDLVGRISRLEFVVVTNRELEEDEFTSYIDSLIMAAEDSVMDDDGKAKIKYYVGYSVFPETSRFSGDLLHEAERAVREALKTNINPLKYQADSSVRPFADSPLFKLTTNELYDAIENAIKGDEFYLVYQPQFDREKKLTGFEAFLRWNSPIYGRISPANLIIAAEHVNAIYKIGLICIRKSMETLAQINKTNPDLTMAINLSSAQLNNTRVLKDFEEITTSYNINRSNVIIDIPEESLLTNINASRPVINGFADLGIKMALDNFGRCYSSLNNIPLFPISLVNLDSHFTSDLKEGSHFRILSSSIIDLLNEIDIPVNATGVASEDQFQALINFGCHYFQGNHLCDPMDEDNVIPYIKSLESN